MAWSTLIFQITFAIILGLVESYPYSPRGLLPCEEDEMCGMMLVKVRSRGREEITQSQLCECQGTQTCPGVWNNTGTVFNITHRRRGMVQFYQPKFCNHFVPRECHPNEVVEISNLTKNKSCACPNGRHLQRATRGRNRAGFTCGR